jgi:hypothetical protein
MIVWTAPVALPGDLPILGYVLSMDDGVNQDPRPVFIGRGRPEVLEYTAGGLTVGLPYLFLVQAINQNGYSSPSATSTFYPCVEPPTMPSPTYVSSSGDAMTIDL